MLFLYNSTIARRILSKYLTSSQQTLLGKQGVRNGEHFLLLRPKKYDVRRYDISFSDISMDQSYAIIGKIRSVSKRQIRRNLTVFSAMLMTKTDQIPIVWFNQKYLIEKLKHDPFVIANGKLDASQLSPAFQVSNFEVCSSFKVAGDGQIFPAYPDIKGVSNKVLVGIVKELLSTSYIVDLIPKELRDQEGLLSIKDALMAFHFPLNQRSLDDALKRLSFDEVFKYMYPRRDRHQKNKTTRSSVSISSDTALVQSYMNALPYALTHAQARVWSNICSDFQSNRSVFRLIQGDVGSGKTDIAILSLLACVSSGYKSAMLVPTEILAEQHYLKLLDRCSSLGVRICLLKGKQRKKERVEVLNALKSDGPLIVVGTHALVQDSVDIVKLGLVVIDEQHRFGVFQRQTLIEKSTIPPHCLFMSATPIPRSLMLTHYGDLDHDVIDEMPPGRLAAKTYFGKIQRLGQVHEFIRLALTSGRQAYVVYPLIEESEHLESLQAAVDGFEALQQVFLDCRVGLLHGQMSNDDKQRVMALFKANEIQLLVSTTVIEVGVDVPNATIMVIMNAERFGLSQLHQLRGRVGRGKDQAHCFLVADPKSVESRQRIKAMLNTANGFELAEEDLKIRGPGNLLGTQQSGEIVFAFANLSNKPLIQRVVQCCDLVLKNPDRYRDIYDYFLQQSAVQAELLN